MFVNKWGKLFLVINLLLLLTACQERRDYQGYIEGYFRYLSSNSAGFLESLLVQRGTPVKVGQVLFILENQPEAAQLAKTQGQLQQAQFNLSNLEKGQRETIIRGVEEQIRQAQANLVLAEATFHRNEQLIKTGAISRQQFDQAKASYDAAQAQYRQLIANLNEARLGARSDIVKSAGAAVDTATAATQSAKWYLTKKTITAPADGIVFDTFYRRGEFIAAGRPVISLLVPADTRVIFYLPEPQLSKLALGQKIIVHCDHCTKSYTAIITFISSQAEYTPPVIFSEKERKKFVYRIEAAFSPEDANQLHPGQPVDVLINNNNNYPVSKKSF